MLFDDVRCLSDAGGINEVHRNTVKINCLLNRIARGAGDVSDNRALTLHEGIEQTRFADVRFAENGDGNTVLDKSPFFRSGKQAR